ncbi:MAG TPA: hypothetical protein VK498_07700, partial [Ferruginibacter sp.]|nr:hypothetical protein [Ferruginibacter sp.]
TEDGVKGMRIHLKFKTYSMKGMDAYVAIYFEDSNGDVLKDKNDKFNSTAGDVAVYKSINPNYDPANYDDLQIFMPYTELDLTPGKYNLTMDIKVIYKEGGIISKLTKYDFEYTKPGTTAAVSKADATYDDMWVDYNITQDGKKGMKIHVKFKALNMKGEDGYVAIYFEKKNGDKINGVTSEYRSTSGQLAVYKSIKPAYDEAIYEDLQLFIPYNEFVIGKGRFDMKMDADVIHKEGGIIKHLGYKDFWVDF